VPRKIGYAGPQARVAARPLRTIVHNPRAQCASATCKMRYCRSAQQRNPTNGNAASRCRLSEMAHCRSAASD
jgi:hypothetical protein